MLCSSTTLCHNDGAGVSDETNAESVSLMPLLIDGHNLIGQMPDISLEDPDDEAKLVSRLKAYCSRTRKRATVVFDQGLPGGRSHVLSNSAVQVIFAPAGRVADGILKERIRNARDPRGLIVVSSDHDVVRVAQSRNARVIRSEDFACQLGSLPGTQSAGAGDKPGATLDEDEVSEWMRLFKKGRGR